jgi:ABC-2 type transport system permease protein
MRQLIAFTKKEFTEVLRTGKGYILLLVFAAFGIMNPMMAKLTPWLFDMLSDSLKSQGITMGKVTVTAMTSWEQYYKNMSMEFIVMVILFCGILVNEYQKGTLINVLTKGLPRWKVIASKGIAMFTIWSVCYWTCFGITFAYNAYFWDNSIASHVVLSALYSYLFGIWLCSVILLASAYLDTFASVLLSVGAIYAIVYLLAIIPKIADYLPVKLTDGLTLLNGSAQIRDYLSALGITLCLTVVAILLSVIGFNRKKI